MIAIDNLEVYGFEAAIRGMRNPMNSWEKSDSIFYHDEGSRDEGDYDILHNYVVASRPLSDDTFKLSCGVGIGPEDEKLMRSLIRGGSVHAKFRRMIGVSMDITAPLYWWKEFDTYKVGTVANSCSTMHKIHSKPFEISDFSTEHLFTSKDPDENENYMYRAQITKLHVEYGEEVVDDILTPEDVMYELIEILEQCRVSFLSTNDKKYWWQLIQLLPSSYNQKRTVTMNYEVLADIYPSRKDHKLDEWRTFCAGMKEYLPYSWIFTGEEKSE